MYPVTVPIKGGTVCVHTFRNILIYQSLNDIVLCRVVYCRGVITGYAARKFLTKQTVTHILPVTATVGRVNEASYWNVQTITGRTNCIARFFRRE